VHSFRILPSLLIVFCLTFASTGAAAQKKKAPAPPDPAAREQRIAQAAEALRARLIETRRDFAIHPELSNREERTSRVIAERLRELGFTDIKTNVARHGVVALLKGGRPGPVIAVRADMDALPVQDVNDTPYKSQTPGVKHACGHDSHMAIQLGVAEILSKMRAEIPGTIKFIFQPAEEGPPLGEEGGAELMVKERVLEDPKPEVIFGIHVFSTIDVGKIGYNSGPTLASSDEFEIKIRGKQVHAAYPHQGVDPILVAAEAIQALQTIRRRIIATEPLVISVATIHGGNRSNILPNEVVLGGTVRTHNDEDVRKRIPDLMREVLDGVTRAHGARYEMDYRWGNPVTYNDPKLVAETLPTIRRVMGEANVYSPAPQMGAEDFAFFAKEVPSFFYYVGVRNQARGIVAAHHTPDFDLDEDGIVIGTKVMASVVTDYLERHAAGK
jgi:amidohydrolase